MSGHRHSDTAQAHDGRDTSSAPDGDSATQAAQAAQKMHEDVNAASAPPAPGADRPALADPAADKFALIDGNHDGKASLDELTKYIEDKKNEVARSSGKMDTSSDDDYALLRNTYMAAFKNENPNSTVTDLKDMQLTEGQTGDLQSKLPRYRSDEVAGKDSMFAMNVRDDRERNRSSEPEMTFADLAHGKTTVNFDDFVAAVKTHNHFTAQDEASFLIKAGNRTIDTATDPKTLAFLDTNASIDFDHFKSIYETSPMLRDRNYVNPLMPSPQPGF